MGGRVLRRRNQTHTAAAQSRATATGVLRPSTYPPERNENAATAASDSAKGTVFRALNVALTTRAVFTGVSIDGIILSSSSEERGPMGRPSCGLSGMVIYAGKWYK